VAISVVRKPELRLQKKNRNRRGSAISHRRTVLLSGSAHNLDSDRLFGSLATA
jgi:hypothetical protein